MEHLENERLWQAFCNTGEIGKYLLYAAMKRAAREKGNE